MNPVSSQADVGRHGLELPVQDVLLQDKRSLPGVPRPQHAPTEGDP
eukprot:CAMPEP_0197190228 /NCGR_PEP_ID=MMETSP1423-20130617/21254_1 /TAXON_ID=476441 /ORGANISM="Pseudo-nitzschia heimii, Strain UNC1101" /LENGTH=45 /DNA_ID= /DNA_START= /DNA_END= /DNA_ORIENTATION=